MSLPNEVGAWDADFSYGYLKRLYGRIQTDFDLCLIGDSLGKASSKRPTGLIRHDVDVSLDRALRLAEMEADWGVGATYHVMIDSPFFDVRSERSADVIHAISTMGHEVGLHYDIVARNTAAADVAIREQDIAQACRELEEIVDGPIRSLSFHRPPAEVIRGPFTIAGRVNAYAASLCEWYLSDSRGRWREGNPLEGIGNPRGDTLQILIHPIWWAEAHQPPGVRLRDFLLELYPSASPQRYDELRTALWDHILYRAADL